jgi:S-adenosylmethionine:tRNA ribosyltransferase-isomerase
MRLADFDYELPPELIAQRPAPERDASRLMVVRRKNAAVEHAQFAEIGRLLRTDDVLVLNNTRVIPARLIGTKLSTGARIEVFLLHPTRDGEWEALVRPGRRVQKRARLTFGDGLLHAEVQGRLRDGTYRIRFDETNDFRERLEAVGRVPLPPYIKREPDEQDKERYQNVFAKRDGAVAAPTAGLHFTEALLNELRAKGITTVELTLHVGLGTFQPVQAENVEEHRLHAEEAELDDATAECLRQARTDGRRIVAVGTTCVRTLETAAQSGEIRPFRGRTSLFILPGFEFRAVDAMVTNFHLPKSSLLMLVSAFAGYDLTSAAYAIAVRERYRFYSYGDAMLIE